MEPGKPGQELPDPGGIHWVGQLIGLMDDFGYIHDLAHASRSWTGVSGGGMPPPSSGEPPWSPERVQLFRDWIAAGCQP